MSGNDDGREVKVMLLRRGSGFHAHAHVPWFASAWAVAKGRSRVYEGPSRKDCPPGNQRSNMMTKDARPLCQLIVGVYTASSFIDVKSNAREKVKRITHLHCPVIDQVDSVHSKPKTVEHDDDHTPSSSL